MNVLMPSWSGIAGIAAHALLALSTEKTAYACSGAVLFALLSMRFTLYIHSMFEHYKLTSSCSTRNVVRVATPAFYTWQQVVRLNAQGIDEVDVGQPP